MKSSQNQETRIYKDILPTEVADDRAYVEILNKIGPYTLTFSSGVEPTYSLFQIVKYLVQNQIPGAMVECGVWRGGSMMLIAHALQHFGDASRELYLYDTFTGMTEPDAVDVDSDGRSQQQIWQEARGKGAVMGYGGTVEQVQQNLRQTGYPEERMHFVAGDVLLTIPARQPERIALLRLDTDWYKSTLHELRHLYPLLVPQGVLIIDDYGWCRGARQATDEYFGALPFKPLLHRVDDKVRVLVKPA